MQLCRSLYYFKPLPTELDERKYGNLAYQVFKRCQSGDYSGHIV